MHVSIDSHKTTVGSSPTVYPCAQGCHALCSFTARRWRLSIGHQHV